MQKKKKTTDRGVCAQAMTAQISSDIAEPVGWFQVKQTPLGCGLRHANLYYY